MEWLLWQFWVERGFAGLPPILDAEPANAPIALNASITDKPSDSR